MPWWGDSRRIRSRHQSSSTLAALRQGLTMSLLINSRGPTHVTLPDTDLTDTADSGTVCPAMPDSAVPSAGSNWANSRGL